MLPLLLGLLVASDFPTFKAQQIDPRVGNVCYALTVADVNGDKKPDIVAVTEDAVVWYENPTWQKRDIVRNATEKDNVCLQALDIDGDGRVDFALGAAWRPADTKGGGTLQWLTRTGAREGQWRVIPLGSEPTLHRMRFGDVLGNGQKQLVVAPLQGRGTKGPNWGEGQGVRILVQSIPADPANSTNLWPTQVADDTLHTVHNLQLVDIDGDELDDIVLAAWEGVFVVRRKPGGEGWFKTKLGSGNQETAPFKGASEVKVGKLSDGRKYIATIEPWHGFQVVVYTPPKAGSPAGTLWDRKVLDEPLAWGHAVWCADVDNDPAHDDELIIGQRDPNNAPGRTPKGPGVYIYDLKPDATATRHVLDDGGVAVEDLLASDLNGDGKVDIIAGGRATHNVKIYWNEKKD